jgi:hypothetical protein
MGIVLRLHLAKVMAFAGLLLAGIGASAALATPGGNGNGPQPTVPGSPGDDCSHGNNGKDCRPDPNENGQDCDDHGNARGNEDHCQASTPTTSTTTTTTQTTTTTPSTSTTTTTTPTTSTGSTTTTSSSPGTTTTTPTSGGTAGTATPPTKPELQKELAKQAKGVRGTRSHVRSNPNELPFTGFPAWLLAAIGATMLAAGFALRRAASYASNSNA